MSPTVLSASLSLESPSEQEEDDAAESEREVPLELLLSDLQDALASRTPKHHSLHGFSNS